MRATRGLEFEQEDERGCRWIYILRFVRSVALVLVTTGITRRGITEMAPAWAYHASTAASVLVLIGAAWLVDAVGRRRMLAGSTALMALVFGSYLFTAGPWGLVAGQIIGICALSQYDMPLLFVIEASALSRRATFSALIGRLGIYSLAGIPLLVLSIPEAGRAVMRMPVPWEAHLVVGVALLAAVAGASLKIPASVDLPPKTPDKLPQFGLPSNWPALLILSASVLALDLASGAGLTAAVLAQREYETLPFWAFANVQSQAGWAALLSTVLLAVGGVWTIKRLGAGSLVTLLIAGMILSVSLTALLGRTSLASSPTFSTYVTSTLVSVVLIAVALRAATARTAPLAAAVVDSAGFLPSVALLTLPPALTYGLGKIALTALSVVMAIAACALFYWVSNREGLGTLGLDPEEMPTVDLGG